MNTILQKSNISIVENAKNREKKNREVSRENGHESYTRGYNVCQSLAAKFVRKILVTSCSLPPAWVVHADDSVTVYEKLFSSMPHVNASNRSKHCKKLVVVFQFHYESF